MLEILIEKTGMTYSFNDDLPYGMLTKLGDRKSEGYASRLVAALSYSPVLSVEDLDDLPSKTNLQLLTNVISHYTSDFIPAPKEKKE